MRTVVCDIETNGLNPTKVWLIVCRDVDTDEVFTFVRPDLDPSAFLDFTRSVGTYVGHYFIQYDYLRVIRKFFPQLVIPWDAIVDTLVCSRLFRFDKEGGHSLEAWAKEFGLKKHPIEDWEQGVTDDMIKRCVDDTEINLRLYRFFRPHLQRKEYIEAIRLEHAMSFICEDMTLNGFGFDKPKALALLDDIDSKLALLDKEIQEAFPPTVYHEIFVPKVTRKDLGYEKGVPFTRTTEVPFNPGSPVQIVAKLNESGWKPFEKTKGHIKAERALKQCRLRKDDPKRKELVEALERFKETGWSVTEDNLATLPPEAPSGARKLAERITLASRRSSLVEWLGLYNEKTESIHGNFLSIGSWTQRMAHQGPNMANIPSQPEVEDKTKPTPVESIKLLYNMPMRSLFRARPKRRLVGVDADGIQLRILAHHMEDQDFIDALVKGRKEDKTDPHSLNCLKLDIGYEFRPRAKTFSTIGVYKAL